jgi:hypothetical protein
MTRRHTSNDKRPEAPVVIAFRNVDICQAVKDGVQQNNTSVQLLSCDLQHMKHVSDDLKMPLLVINNMYCDVASKDVVYDGFYYHNKNAE